jgi:hypothetical protein
MIPAQIGRLEGEISPRSLKSTETMPRRLQDVIEKERGGQPSTKMYHYE